ncbi:hypothetical protein MIS45_08870 [Wielerella bovis]|uniref:hypothetical protein n=1 Tax=Wielerella bovis TaxID=2917790 RepID=UPI002019E6C1|nr:hypothetical protein [Wielerella bovis]ULJ68877.1 hypothetical protein MIS45_08870 [Wielerella bovis]
MMLTLHIYFNQIQIHHNGVTINHRGTFSNSRMIVADFLAFQAAIKMAAEKQIYTPPSKLFGNLRATPIGLDVREQLADGLSPVEYKVLLETLLALGIKPVKPEQVLYHDKIPFQAV